MLRLIACLSAFRLAAFAAVIAQFDLSAPEGVETGESGQVAGWNSASGLVLVPAVTNSPAWSAPELAATNGFDGVFFNLSTNPASPLAFAGTATNTVSTLFLVVSGSSGGYSTLVHAPAVAAVTPYALEPEYDPAETGGGLLRVNGHAAPQFGAGVRHIVEVDFAEPVALRDIFIGGTPACAAWGQNWQGAVYEAVVLDGPPGDGARRAIRNYFALRYGVAGLPSAGLPYVAEALALGLNAHGYFGTQVIFK